MQRAADARPTPNPRRILWGVALSVAFFLTGIGRALLGAVLPAMLQQWHLTDRLGGLLMFLAWGSSSFSALFVRKNPQRIAIVGMALTAVATVGLALGTRPVLVPLVLLYGAGLGIAMTAINTARSLEVDEESRSREMNRLNMLWAMGACVCPVLALRSLHSLRVNATYGFVAIAFAAATALMTFGYKGKPPATIEYQEQRGNGRLPIYFCLLAGLAVGVESGVGGWLTTYAQRVGQTAGAAVSANTLFWVGLLLSRAAHAYLKPNWIRTPTALAAHKLAVVLSTGLMLALPGGTALLAAAALAGFGLGPLYPTVLAFVLGRYRSKIIFVSAGIGAAVVPWIMGIVSTATGSLRNGLWIPFVSAAILLLLAIFPFSGTQRIGFLGQPAEASTDS